MAKNFLARAIALGRTGMQQNAGGPFGAVVVKDGRIIGEGYNQVTSTNDPTAHAEVLAIRNACHFLQTFSLSNCVLYASCEPCPMCASAVYWARLDAVHYAATRDDAARIGFDDTFIYNELQRGGEQRKIRFIQQADQEAEVLLVEWTRKGGRLEY